MKWLVGGKIEREGAGNAQEVGTVMWQEADLDVKLVQIRKEKSEIKFH